MKSTVGIYALATLATTVLSGPIEKRQDGVDFTKIDYPDGTGANLHEYPPGTGENLHEYPPSTGENLPLYPNTTCPKPVFNFTSTYHVRAVPGEVVNGTTNPQPTGGLQGAEGFYDFGINVDLDLICYSIKLTGFRGNYQSPARTATHVHQGARGASGPPRLVFPNPVGDGDVRYSFGCMTGPFTTGIVVNGTDTGEGFVLSRIEDNPSGFFADVHSSLAVPGAVRGQFPG